jgi:SpoVK/Ycf46/Vps4 family AAA+-type ATPase
VARIIGKIYQKLGVLPKGNVFVECSRKDLVGEYQGHTAKKTHDKVIEALGGVLFIDEAYSLVQGQGDSFGLEALSTLVADIENYRDSIMVILAGYSEEIDELISHNPGLVSRFPNEILFEDYTVDEMVDIFNYIVREKGMLLDRNTIDAIYRLIKEKSGKKDFGNARGIRNLVEKVKASMERRLMEMKSEGEILSRNDYDIVKVQDIEAVINQKSVKEKTIDELMIELENMTGLASVKRKVREMVALIKRKQMSEVLNYKINNKFGSLHLVFLGNAGTGKTTVARLIGQIYEKLGVLKNGDIFVECSRAGLIGQYQGHTTKKVEDKVKEAEGGILFIDEAYDLCHGSNDDFGTEIVSTLLKAIEDKRDNLMVIMAGYQDRIEEFFGTNQGLKSRMATQIIFEDYTVEELRCIFYYMAEADHLIVEEELESFIEQRISEELQKNTDFGNARGVRNLYEEVLRKQALRLFDLETGSITREQFTTIIKEDFK